MPRPWDFSLPPPRPISLHPNAGTHAGRLGQTCMASSPCLSPLVLTQAPPARGTRPWSLPEQACWQPAGNTAAPGGVWACLSPTAPWCVRGRPAGAHNGEKLQLQRSWSAGNRHPPRRGEARTQTCPGAPSSRARQSHSLSQSKLLGLQCGAQTAPSRCVRAPHARKQQPGLAVVKQVPENQPPTPAHPRKPERPAQGVGAWAQTGSLLGAGQGALTHSWGTAADGEPHVTTKRHAP